MLISSPYFQKPLSCFSSIFTRLVILILHTDFGIAFYVSFKKFLNHVKSTNENSLKRPFQPHELFILANINFRCFRNKATVCYLTKTIADTMQVEHRLMSILVSTRRKLKSEASIYSHRTLQHYNT